MKKISSPISREKKSNYTSNKHSYLEIQEGSSSLEIKIMKWGFKLINILNKMNPWVRYPLAILLIGIGIAGIFLPILPGFVFLVPGAGIFSKTAQLWLENLLEKYINWKESKLTK